MADIRIATTTSVFDSGLAARLTTVFSNYQTATY